MISDKSYDCTFEEAGSKHCGLMQLIDDTRDWSIHQGSEPGRVGPEADHTTGQISGMY